MWWGDWTLGETRDLYFTTRRFSTGAPFTLAGTPAVAAYEDNGTTEITAGITLTVDFDSRTGLNHLRVVATSGNGFEAGKSYSLVLTAGTVDSVSVAGEVVGGFSVEREPSFGRLGAPAGASIAADVAGVQSDTNDIQTRLPAALVSGRMDSSVGAMAANTLTASALAADAVTEIQAGLSTLDAAGVRSAVGLASANLDTQLAAIDDFLDTEVAAIKAKTDNLPADPADASDIAAAFSTVNTTLATIAGYLDTEVAAILAAVDTEVAAIKAKTDQLTFTTANRVDCQVFGMEAGTVTAAAVATGAIDADALAADVVNDIWMGTALTEAYRGTGAAGTPAQLLYEILQNITEFAISGTTKTVKKLDGSTTAKTYTLDSSTTPTSITEAT